MYDEITDHDRERRQLFGAAAVRAGTPDYRHNDDATNVVDALTNVMHYCHAQGVDWDRATEAAIGHFAHEAARCTCPPTIEPHSVACPQYVEHGLAEIRSAFADLDRREYEGS